MLGWRKKLMSQIGNASSTGSHNLKRKKKSDSVNNDRKRTKVASASSESTLAPHSSEGNGYSASDLLERLNSFGNRSLYNEFAKFKNEKISGTFTASQCLENASRNRYPDVLCLDQSRVKLGRESESSLSSDYINANFVDGYKQKKAYIATQGPLHNTCEDFWRMVWEQSVFVLVMTTRIAEQGHQKCVQYWPKQSGKTLSWKSFSVINRSVNVVEQFVETKLILRKDETGEERSLVHLFFTRWPDHGVPSNAEELLSFIFYVRKKQRDHLAKSNSSSDSTSDHPILVHCSAGIGRTGTFITVDICARSVADTGRLDILAVVQKLRSQRAHSIQTVDQYIFCHTAIAELCRMEGYGQCESEEDNRTAAKNTTLESGPIEPE